MNVHYYLKEGDYLIGWGMVDESDLDTVQLDSDQELILGSIPEALNERPQEESRLNLVTKLWEPLQKSTFEQWLEVRLLREALFRNTEWVRSRCMDQGVPVPQEWLDYWQALRDITNQPDPANIIWPEKPS